MKNAIEIEKISFSYKNAKIIVDLSLQIEEGKITAIAGKNGSGKSTLGKILVGLEKPEQGKITILGREWIPENTSIIRGDISLVFQNPNNQIIGNRVIDDLAFSLENRGVSKSEMERRILELSRKLGIEELLNKDPVTLSGGQKQMVAIAGVLIFNPKIIIFDEINSMLDIVWKNKILELIKILKKEHTIILITHDPEELIVSDRIVYLENGKIISDMPSKEFYNNSSFIKKQSLEIPFIVEIENYLKKNCENREGIEQWLNRLK
ncbi:MAG: ATP-binding cassette domain-containing protein [Fusobacteriaceae bacterium]